jgi:iron complex transport system permease protein
MKNQRAILWLVAFALLLGTLFFLELANGSVRIPFADVASILSGGQAQKATWATIIFQFRLPRAITALFAGAALAVSGLSLQALFRNPLAGPFVLGISSGASLGVALVVLSAGAGQWLNLAGSLSSVAAASLGAALTLGFVLLGSRRVQGMATLLLFGLMIGYVTGALVNLLVYFSAPEQVQAYVLWTIGSFAGVSLEQLQVLVPVLSLGLVASLFLSKPLNLLLLGEEQARTLGLRIKATRLGIIVSTALLAGGVTAFCGPVAFLDLAVPHLCRGLLRTADHRWLMPAAALLGAVLALFADLLAQLPGSLILPLNTVTALIGAPVVVFVIFRHQRA